MQIVYDETHKACRVCTHITRSCTVAIAKVRERKENAKDYIGIIMKEKAQNDKSNKWKKIEVEEFIV